MSTTRDYGLAALAVAAVVGGLVYRHRSSSSEGHGKKEEDDTGAVPSTVANNITGRPPREVDWDTIALPIIVGIGGASGSGKTSIAELVEAKLTAAGIKCANLSADSYYISLPEGKDPALHNFDEPDALELGLMARHLQAIKRGESVKVPHYDFTIHKRVGETTTLDPPEVLFVDGIFALCVEELRDTFDLRLFATEDQDVCLGRRLRRDIRERGRDPDSVITQYERFVKPAFSRFIAPSAASAHLLVPHGKMNTVAVQFLASELQRVVKQRRS